MERDLMPRMPLFIVSHICFLCPHPQLQCKTRVLLSCLMAACCQSRNVGLATPGPVFHWWGNWGYCWPFDNTSHGTVQCCQHSSVAVAFLPYECWWPQSLHMTKFIVQELVLFWLGLCLLWMSCSFYLAETQRISPQQHPHLRKVSVSESNVLLDEEVLTDPKIQALLLTVLVRFLSVYSLLLSETVTLCMLLAVFPASQGSASLWCASRFFWSSFLGITIRNVFKEQILNFHYSILPCRTCPTIVPFFLAAYYHRLILYDKMILIHYTCKVKKCKLLESQRNSVFQWLTVNRGTVWWCFLQLDQSSHHSWGNSDRFSCLLLTKNN